MVCHVNPFVDIHDFLTIRTKYLLINSALDSFVMAKNTLNYKFTTGGKAYCSAYDNKWYVTDI